MRLNLLRLRHHEHLKESNNLEQHLRPTHAA